MTRTRHFLREAGRMCAHVTDQQAEKYKLWAIRFTSALFLTWACWVSSSLAQGGRFTADEGRDHEKRIRDIEVWRNALEIPPAWFAEDVDELQASIKILQVALNDLSIQIAVHDAVDRGP